MSNISISSENLNRFNKRLQKSLTEHFKTQITLNDASLILAKTMGVNSIFELQQFLKKENLNISVVEKAKELIQHIQSYFDTNKKTSIQEFAFIDYCGDYCLQFLVNSKFGKQEYIGFYFNSNAKQYWAENQKDYLLTVQDESFLKEITDYWSNESEDNILLGAKILKRLRIEDDMFIFKHETLNKKQTP